MRIESNLFELCRMSRYSIIINLVNLNVFYLKGPLDFVACLSKEGSARRP